MAAQELVILSSSPIPRAEAASPAVRKYVDSRRHSLIIPPESLLPRNEPPKPNSKLKTGSRSAKAPENAALGFVTAGLLLKEQRDSASCEDGDVRLQSGKAEDGKERRTGTKRQASKKERGKSEKRWSGETQSEYDGANAAEGGIGSNLVEPHEKNPKERKPTRPRVSESDADLPMIPTLRAVPVGAKAKKGNESSATKSAAEVFDPADRFEKQSLPLPNKTTQIAAPCKKPATAEGARLQKKYLSSTYVHDSDSGSETASITADTDKPSLEVVENPLQTTVYQTAPKPANSALESAMYTVSVQHQLAEVSTGKRARARKADTTGDQQPRKKKTETTKAPRKSAKQDAAAPRKGRPPTKRKTGATSKHFYDSPSTATTLLDGVPGQQIMTFASKIDGLSIGIDRSEREWDSGSISHAPDIVPVEAPTTAVIQGHPNDRAVERRRSWTPKADTLEDLVQAPSASATALETSNATEQASFRALLSNFSYGPAAESPSKPEPRSRKKAPLKRKRDVPGSDARASPAQEKPKAKKKRIKTITALATEKYLQPEHTASAPSAIGPPVADANPNQASTVPDTSASTKPAVQKPRLGVSKKPPAKSKKSNAKSRTVVPCTDNLLNPAQALDALQHQNLLFGTSSQLVQESSPTYLRDLQRAIRISEQDYLAEKAAALSTDQAASARVKFALVKSKSAAIWNAGSRNFEGGLLRSMRRQKLVAALDEIPTMEDVEAPAVLPQSPTSKLDNYGEAGRATDREHPTDSQAQRLNEHTAIRSSTQDQTHTETIAEDEVTSLTHTPDRSPSADYHLDEPFPSEDFGFENSGHLSYEPAVAAFFPPAVTPPTPNKGVQSASNFVEPLHDQALANGDRVETEGHASDNIEESEFVDIDDLLSPHLPVSSCSLSQRKPPTTPILRRALSPIPSHPNIPSPTKIGSTKPFSTLAKSSAGATAGQKTDTDPPPKKARAASKVKRGKRATDDQEAPKKVGSRQIPKVATPKRARKKKHEVDEWTHIDEISDSEVECTPSPPRRHLSASQPLELASEAQDTADPEGEKADWLSLKSELYATITNTIRDQPRTEDPSQPTWHEKILLYDPIVLEDLTAWLNHKGVKLPGIVVAPTKKTKRKRRLNTTTHEDTPVKEWMVQKWCEDSGICCLWKEGVRGGVRNRY